jgi:hypothetical protein
MSAENKQVVIYDIQSDNLHTSNITLVLSKDQDKYYPHYDNPGEEELKSSLHSVKPNVWRHVAKKDLSLCYMDSKTNVPECLSAKQVQEYEKQKLERLKQDPISNRLTRYIPNMMQNMAKQMAPILWHEDEARKMGFTDHFISNMSYMLGRKAAFTQPNHMWALVLSYRNGMTKTIRELQEYVPDQETETSIMNKTFSQEEEEETNENEENENNERSRSRSRSPARDKSHVKTRTRSP